MFELSRRLSLPGPTFGRHDWKTDILPPTDAYKIKIVLISKKKAYEKQI